MISTKWTEIGNENIKKVYLEKSENRMKDCYQYKLKSKSILNLVVPSIYDKLKT